MTANELPAVLPPDTPSDIVDFFSYWSSLPRIGLVPNLSDYLDRAPPKLQPYFGISDIHSPTKMTMRLFGTGLVELAGNDPTGTPLELLYSEKIRARMGKAVWDVVAMPAAYLCVRSIRRHSGRILDGASICLPLSNHSATANTAITYANFSKDDVKFAEQDQMELVQDWRVTHWIDLGAGVPD